MKGSGKSVYLTVLTQQLRKSVSRRFDAQITPVDHNSRLMEKLATWRNAMDSGGGLPESTERYSPGETVPAVLEWRYDRERLGISKKEATILSFYDPSGEDLETSALASEQHYLAAATGLLFLVDPFGLPSNREAAISRGIPKERISNVDPSQVLRSITDMLRAAESTKGTKLIKRPLAVVVTKVDAFFKEFDSAHAIRRPAPEGNYFDERDSLDQHDHVEALIAEWGGEELLTQLQFGYKNYRLFAASALGAEPDYRRGRANQVGVLPHRVVEPLLWLMAENGFIPKGGS